MLDEPQCIVTVFVEGAGMEPADLREPATLTEVARSLRAIHELGEPLPTSFDSFRVVETYARNRPRARRARCPPPTSEAHGHARAIEAALSGPEHEPVPCHNDLLAANFIRGAKQLWIVDWEYAGMGDRYFDLANFAVNNELGEAGELDLLEAYFAEPPSARRVGDASPDEVHVRLPRGDVGSGPDRALRARLRLPGLRAQALRAHARRPQPTPTSRPGSRRRVSPRAELPDAARCVIIGGGVGGTSIAYHLAELGWDDVVLLERAELTSGSTFHSAGLVGQLRGSVSLTKMMMHSVELYRRVGEESEFDPGWVECGGIRLASSEERMEELRRQAGWAKTFGLPLELISAEEAKELFPLMSTDGVVGAAWLPTDGYIDPAQLTYALADGARRGRLPRVHLDPGRRDRGRATGGCAAFAPSAATSRPRWWSTPAACTRRRSAGWRAFACR